MKNLMEKIEKAKMTYTFGSSTRRYMLCVQDYCDISNASNNIFAAIDNGFFCGFMQGYKAALAEMKKKARAK